MKGAVYLKGVWRGICLVDVRMQTCVHDYEVILLKYSDIGMKPSIGHLGDLARNHLIYETNWI